MKTRYPLYALTLIVLAPLAGGLHAEESADRIGDRLGKVPDGWIRIDIGVTRQGTPIPCLLARNDLDVMTNKTRILVIAGLDGSKKSTDAALSGLKWFATSDAAAKYRKRFTLSVVPAANPDGLLSGRGPENLSGGRPGDDFPPKGTAYNSPTTPESAYIWRWIAIHGPDVVVELGPGKPSRLSAALNDRDTGLTLIELLAYAGDSLEDYCDRIANEAHFPVSPTRRRLQKRASRSPREVAAQLAKVYGQKINRVVYTETVALIGRTRFLKLIGQADQIQSQIVPILEPYVSGKKTALPQKTSGSALAGQLIFAELAHETGRTEYVQLVQAAADRAFGPDGKPQEAMPAHSEMSDAVFMACPILVEAGSLTGETKYYDMALTHLRFMRKLVQRQDGLYRHSPLDEAAWGRGNGFPALGLALCLERLPEDHPGRAEMLAAFHTHLAALLKHQDPTGMWHQVIDHPESYRELTSTCMITYAMARGIRRGWLDGKTYGPAVEKAWNALKLRIAPDGTLVDVCTGTGKQKNLRAYYDRTAILGKDSRGGSMSLLVATEIMEYEKAGLLKH